MESLVAQAQGITKVQIELKTSGRGAIMAIDGGKAIIIVYLLVSVGAISTFVLILGGGLEWFADRLRGRATIPSATRPCARPQRSRTAGTRHTNQPTK